MAKIRLPNNWVPRPYQLPLWRYFEHDFPGKRAIEIAHRRWGKDDVALHLTACSALEHPATYWHMLPEYAQARKAIWDAVNPATGMRRIDEAFPLPFRANTRDDTMFIRFTNGSTWQVVGSDNYNTLVGTPPYGLVISEWATAHPAAWAYLAPILRVNGGWALFITTPRGENHAKDLYDQWRHEPGHYAELQTIDDTGIVSKEDIEKERRDYTAIFGEAVADSLIAQEYFCSFNAAVLGAFWSRELNLIDLRGQIGDHEAELDQRVHTAWDLGMDDSTVVIWWQVAGREIRVVDYYEASGVGLDHYADIVRSKPYRRGNDYVPHDIKVRELGTGKSRAEVMRSLGLKPTLVPDHHVEDRINAGRVTIPHCWFNRIRCGELVKRLRQYQTEYDEKNRVFKQVPKRNYAIHAADAFGYMCMAWKFAKDPPPPAPEGKTIYQMTVDELWAFKDQGAFEL